MRRLRCPVVTIGVLLSVCLVFFVMAVRTAPAANGRDFAGFYTLSNASPSGGGYTLTFSARVFNYSGADVIDAAILLRGCMPLSKGCASFQQINIDATRSVRVSAQVTVPGPVYDHWQKGGQPELIVQFTNAKGEKQSERVDLAPDHAGIRTREN